MNTYNITFDDGTQAKINAETSEEAIRNGQEMYRKAVISFSDDNKVEKQPMSALDSMKHGGPNP